MNTKTRATYYTPEKVTAAQANVQQFSWAQNARTQAVNKANEYMTKGLDFLWNSVTSAELPRSYGVNQVLGSPVTGRDIDRFGNYPYQADPINQPWKIVDPSSGYTFPTNDFGAYYNSGLNEQGFFEPELADRSLLVNTLYPEKGPDWGVDDGFGWVDDLGNRYTFIAYYNHWFLWYGGNALLQDAITSFRNAYLYTGNVQYAQAGTVLLDRIADVYPDLDTNKHDKTIFLNSHGGTGHGKAVGSIWETSLIKEFVSAYDAFFPAMDDPVILQFLENKAKQYQLMNRKSTVEALRRNIEDGLIRQVYPGVLSAEIRGNTGMHQSALAMAAIVIDHLPETQIWLDHIFQTGGYVANPPSVTGGNILNMLITDVDRDGAGNEAAPSYNLIWLSQLQLTADILEGYDLYPDADLYENVKLRKMFSAFYPLLLSERYTANIGDNSSTGNPNLSSIRLADMVKAFDKFGDPIFAQLAYFLNNNSAEGIHMDIFTANPDRIADRIRDAVAEHGPLNLGSTQMTGFGLAALRDGKSQLESMDLSDSLGLSHGFPSNTLRDIWMYYGRNTGHGHRDTLNLGMNAFGLDLAPDLGYPEFADSIDMHRAQWVINTISHNTVVVDQRKQGPQWVAEPKHFDDSGKVKLIDVEAPKVYPQTELYKRTTAMIQIDEANSYAIDFFRVKGGNDHHFSFHGAEGTVTTEGLTMVDQPTGTYAGPNVAYGQRVDDIEGPGYMGSGFHYLKNVARDANPGQQFSIDWKVVDTWEALPEPADIHLRLTMLGPVHEVALTDGVPPQNKPGNPETLRYFIAHRTGTNLDTVFTSVIEPYKNDRTITAIEELEVKSGGAVVTHNDVKAVKVTLVNGRVDYIISALDPTIEYVIADKLKFKGFMGVYAENEGELVYRYVQDGAYIALLSELVVDGVGAVTGSVVTFTAIPSIENEIVVQLDPTSLLAAGIQISELIGRTVYIENDRVRNAAYEIRGMTELGQHNYQLDIGDSTLIRSFVDAYDFSKGYVYDIAPQAQLRIPFGRMTYL